MAARSCARITTDKDIVRRPGHDVAASQQAWGPAPPAERVSALYRDAGLAPPRPAELVASLKADERGVKEAIELLTRGGTLVRVQDLHFARVALDGLRLRLIAYLNAHGQITAQEWKELVGQTRKFTIPLAEFFDAEKRFPRSLI
ncbi:MAG: hypothetical protein EXR72_20125 [Myxococcales bacterium]|nr:hypothetical protein [Myxococcales bacterium]